MFWVRHEGYTPIYTLRVHLTWIRSLACAATDCLLHMDKSHQRWVKNLYVYTLYIIQNIFRVCIAIIQYLCLRGIESMWKSNEISLSTPHEMSNPMMSIFRLTTDWTLEKNHQNEKHEYEHLKERKNGN